MQFRGQIAEPLAMLPATAEFGIPMRTVPVTTITVPGAVQTRVLGINAHGVITGYCERGGTFLSFIGTPIN